MTRSVARPAVTPMPLHPTCSAARSHLEVATTPYPFAGHINPGFFR